MKRQSVKRKRSLAQSSIGDHDAAAENTTPRRKSTRSVFSSVNYADESSDAENDNQKSKNVKLRQKKISNKKSKDIQHDQIGLSDENNVQEIAINIDQPQTSIDTRLHKTPKSKPKSKTLDTRNDSDCSESSDDDSDCSESVDSSSDSEEETNENDKIVAVNHFVHDDDAFKQEISNFHDKLESWVEKELNVLAQIDTTIDIEKVSALVKEKSSEFLACLNAMLDNLDKMRLCALNCGSPYRSCKFLYQVFVFCVKQYGSQYDYRNFFTDDLFNTLLRDYVNMYAFDRRRKFCPNVGISKGTGNAVVTDHLKASSISREVRMLSSTLYALSCKISDENSELLCQISQNRLEKEINQQRQNEDTEDLKWPFTLYDHNWLLQKFRINTILDLTNSTFIAVMSYLGLRKSTAMAISLKDITIAQNGRNVVHIIIDLIHLKERTESQKVFIPGNLVPVDVAGLLILYLDSRKVFESGLHELNPIFKVKEDHEDEPLFVLSYTDAIEELSNKLDAPRFAISDRSFRKAHCWNIFFRTKTFNPGRALELIEEDLVSVGTWSTKNCMQSYLSGGCDQIRSICDRIDDLQPVPTTFDAAEHFVFLVDALQTISDWKVDKNDPAVEEMEKKLIQSGCKQIETLKEYSQQLVSSINFYKKAKVVIGNTELPKIAINVLPKSVDLGTSYVEGKEVFVESRLTCNVCKGICIKENQAVKKYNAKIFNYDKKIYREVTGLDDGGFESGIAEQYCPTDENQRKCLVQMFKEWSLEQQ